MRTYIYLAFFLLYSFNIQAQYKFQSVLGEFEGDQLLQKLVEEYKPSVVLDYSDARDTMYKVIYNQNDTVYGVYSNHGHFLPDNVDPSVYLYDNGQNSGINAEHTYPQSKGAANGNAKSDLHHLFPTKINVNSDRGSLPFNEINDNYTQNWYYKNIILHNTPQMNIDNYSEQTNTFFEPKEGHKGNVARAMFYFFTMYNQEATAAEPNYFESQKKVLCDWHILDPVDSLEWERSLIIGKYQDGKPNPYVLDCSLAARTYCDIISDECKTVGTKEYNSENQIKMVLYPTIVEDKLNVKFINPNLKNIKIEIYNLIGEKIYSENIKLNNLNIEDYEIDASKFHNGAHILKIQGLNNHQLINNNKLFIKI